jgi:flavin reductase (DIM6/NTAB) family NADH-FMN oxidoreductase RutF
MQTDATRTGQTVSSEAFRGAMAAVCAPVTVVTTLVGDEPYGSTVSAFASLSLDPPMVSVALDGRSRLLDAIRRSGAFGVNVLHHDQPDLARRFATPGVERFADLAWERDGGVPRLDAAAAWIACTLAGAVPGGDHTLLLGAVTRAAHTDLPPLTYARRTFGTHAARPTAAAGPPATAGPPRIVRPIAAAGTPLDHGESR